ncbi:MAG: UDP-3-O-acyl-N-acetylglucosamine deacetylase [Armatimonadota bacterium]
MQGIADFMRRQTLRQSVELTGLGVRSGRDITITIAPSVCGGGIVIERTDIDAAWPASLDHVVEVPGCTSIGSSAGRVDFVEHLMAVLWAHRITDARIMVDGPEIPLFNGSAAPFFEAVKRCGTNPVDGELAPVTCDRGIFEIGEDKAIMALPADMPVLAYSLLHPHPLIGHQYAEFRPDSDDFGEMLAPARTFATKQELDELMEAGYIAAGSEENCLVVYDNGYCDEPFAPNAFARHKLVDMIGDLYLLGRPVNARIVAYRTGHKENRTLTKKIRDE